MRCRGRRVERARLIGRNVRWLKDIRRTALVASGAARHVLNVSFVARFALKLLAPAGKAQEISAALRSLARRARQEWGCLSFDVYACVEDENRIFMQVDWSDRRALAAWVRSEDFTQVLAIVEISAVPPTFEFRIDDEVRGLDYVAEVRDDVETA